MIKSGAFLFLILLLLKRSESKVTAHKQHVCGGEVWVLKDCNFKLSVSRFG